MGQFYPDFGLQGVLIAAHEQNDLFLALRTSFVMFLLFLKGSPLGEWSGVLF